MKYVLDTHAWLWWNLRPEELSEKTLALLDNARGENEFLLSAISLWEFCKLVEKKRIVIRGEPEEWMAAALRMPRLSLAPLTPRIACLSTTLPEGFHQDPADQIIVATARAENAILITRDERIARYPHVQTIW